MVFFCDIVLVFAKTIDGSIEYGEGWALFFLCQLTKQIGAKHIDVGPIIEIVDLLEGIVIVPRRKMMRILIGGPAFKIGRLQPMPPSIVCGCGGCLLTLVSRRMALLPFTKIMKVV